MYSPFLIDSTVIYHVPHIPSIESTTRYNHALAIGKHTQYPVLITYSQPPPSIRDQYEETYIIGSDITETSGLKQNAPLVKNIINNSLTIVEQYNDPIYVTNFDILPTISGYLSNKYWVVDVYDDPMQLYYGKSTSYSTRVIWRSVVWGIQKLLNQADCGIITLHPAGSYPFGNTQRFRINAAPTSIIQPKFQPGGDVLNGVWVGKQKVGYGIEILINTLAEFNTSIHIDVFGKPYIEAQRLAEQKNVSNQFTFHGRVPHATVRRAVANATVGFALLSDRRDFVYSYPIKVGEYLAGGTIPIMSDFPGMRRLADSAGVYIKPNSNDLANILTKFNSMNSETQRSKMENARERAECITWVNERIQFVRDIIH